MVKMDNQQQEEQERVHKLKKLTKKYFWEQKWKEISQILLVLFIIWSIAGVVFQVGWICEGAFLEETNGKCIIPYEPLFPHWMMYSGLITTGIWIILGLIYWVQTNWEEARERAKKKLKGEKGNE